MSFSEVSGKSLRKNEKLKRSVIISKLLVMLALCTQLPMACHSYSDFSRSTRTTPNKLDLVGTWAPDSSTINDMKGRGGYDLAMETKLILNADGSFEMVNMPDWWFTDSGESNKGFLNNSGTWMLSQDSRAEWSVILHTSRGITHLSLFGSKDSYRLEAYIGDPDEAKIMTFVKKQ